MGHILDYRRIQERLGENEMNSKPLVYADKLIEEHKRSPLWWHLKNLNYTASGYGRKIPTEHMVRIGKRWYRVYCCIFSNIGTLYIRRKVHPFMIVSDTHHWS